MLDQHLAVRIDNTDGTIGWNFKSLIVGAVFFGLLCHESDVGHGTHRTRIEGTILFAKINRLRIDARV